MTNLDIHHDPEQAADPARRGALKTLLGGAAAAGLTALGLGASEAQAKGGFGVNKAPLLRVSKDIETRKEKIRKAGIAKSAKWYKREYLKQHNIAITDAQALELATIAWDKRHPQ